MTLEEIMIKKHDEEKRRLEERQRQEIDSMLNRDLREFGKREESKFLFGEGKTRLTASDIAELTKEYEQEQIKRHFNAQLLIDRPYLRDFSP